MKNKNLNVAKKQKNDEFYTMLSDIENELKHYKKQLENKIIFCNCDDPFKSNFVKYFINNFKKLKLKKLTTLHFSEKPYKFEYNGNKNNYSITKINCNGDFRSDESIELLKQSDIIITNPPFSLFKEFIPTIVKYNKKFLIIGPEGAMIYNSIFPLIMENKIRFGHNHGMKFTDKNNNIQKFGNVAWYTNLETNIQNKKLKLNKKYNKLDYPKYDDYDAINVDRLNDIPNNYFGEIGVPQSILFKYNPEQFEIIQFNGISRRPLHINGKKKYARIIIKRRNDENL